MAADEPWTPARVEAALRAAMVTLRQIPARNLLPAGFKVAWPDVVRDWEAYGWDRAARPRLQATAEQIRDMDVALGWCWNWLHPAACVGSRLVEDTGNIVLMRAAGLTWERIGEWRLKRWLAPRAAQGQRMIPGGNSIKQLRQHQRAGIDLIAQKLGAGVPIAETLRQEREEWGVTVEVARQGETLGEGTYGPVHARAAWGMRKRR